MEQASTLKRLIYRRVIIVNVFLILLSFAIIWKLIDINLIKGDELRQKAQKVYFKEKIVEPDRGNIYSEDGSLLVASIPRFEVRMDPLAEGISQELFYSKLDSLALCIASVTDEDPDRIKQRLEQARKKGNRYVLIGKKLDFLQLKQLKQCPILRRGRYKGGMIVITQNKRFYPFGILAHRTLGYVREGIPPVGIEGYFDKYLRGKPGKEIMQLIPGGTWIPFRELEHPENGYDIITTIDPNIQDIVEDILLQTLQKHDADHGCAIVMEVATGKIRAMANLGRTENGSYWELYNYCVGERNEPGSTFKLASLLALLEQGYSLDDTVNVFNGTYKFYNRLMKDAPGVKKGIITLKEAIAQSSNVGISRLIYREFGDDPQQFLSYLKRFGLTKKTGVTILGEPEPIIKNVNDPTWSGTTLPWMAVGYEVKLTPLQTLTLYNGVANGGRIMKPMLVSAIAKEGMVVKEFEPEVLADDIASSESIEKAVEALKEVVESGTAKHIKNPYFPIAGKTGTALIAEDKSGYKKVYQSSFVAFFPADNPIYSVIVVVNKPRRGYYGSQVAAPAVRKIADRLIARYNAEYPIVDAMAVLRKDTTSKVPLIAGGYGEEVNRLLEWAEFPSVEGKWIAVKADSALSIDAVNPNIVPDVRGLALTDAIFLLNTVGLKVVVEGIPSGGLVVWQHPEPGKPVDNYSVAKIILR